MTKGDQLALRAIVAYMAAVVIGGAVAGVGGAFSAAVGVFLTLVILDSYLEWGDA